MNHRDRKDHKENRHFAVPIAFFRIDFLSLLRFFAAKLPRVPVHHSPTEMSSLFSKAGLTKKRASVRKRKISALSDEMRFVFARAAN